MLDASSAEIDDLAYAVLEVLSRSAAYHVNPNCRTVDHIIAADMLSECVALTRRLRSGGHVDVDRVQGAILECWGTHAVWGCPASDSMSVSLIHELFSMVEDSEGTISALLRVVVVYCVFSVLSLTQGGYMRSLRLVTVDLTAMLTPLLRRAPRQSAVTWTALASVGVVTAAWLLRRGLQR